MRILSSFALIPVVVAVAWWTPSAALFVAICIGLALYELFTMLRQGGYAPHSALGIGIGLLLWAAATFQPFSPLDLRGLVIALSIIAALCYELARHERSNGLINWALTFCGAYYIGGLMSYYVLLRQLNTPLSGGWLASLGIPPGTAWILFVLAVTWLQDTAAYFVGRRFGRHKLAPVLSPKKTWEGFAGGLLMSVLVALLADALLGLPISSPAAALAGALAGVVGPIGDLAESLIKRQIGIKDSGTIIPGHGGLLDRIDSLMFTAPLIYYIALLTLLP